MFFLSRLGIYLEYDFLILKNRFEYNSIFIPTYVLKSILVVFKGKKLTFQGKQFLLKTLMVHKYLVG